MEDVVEIYREVVGVPSVASARIANADTPGHVRVYSQWSQRDLERGEKVKFSRNHIIQLDVVFSTPPSDVSTEVLNRESPSGRYRAILRKVTNKKGDEKHYFEVWDDERKVHNIDCDTIEQHGKIYADAQFGCLEWSYSETHLLYVAEKKRPKAKSFFDKKATAEDSQKKDEVALGEEHVYQDNWGEQLSTKSVPVLCVLDIDSGVASTLDNVPEDVSPGQAVWCANDLGVICVGWRHVPYRLGLTYCPIRRSALFYIDLKTSKCTILGSDDRAVRNPRFSPNHSKLVYLDNNVGGPHAQCSRLMMCDWSTKGMVPVVDVIRNAPACGFPGIYGDGLIRRCWSEDSKRVIIQTQWRSKQELVVIHTETGTITRLTEDPAIGCWRLLDVHNDLVVAACSSPNQPQYLVRVVTVAMLVMKGGVFLFCFDIPNIIKYHHPDTQDDLIINWVKVLVVGSLPSEGKENTISWTKLDTDVASVADISWKIFTLKAPEDHINKSFISVDYECFLLEPQPSSSPDKLPLVAYLHGGPHSVFTTDYIPYLVGLCRCGYAVLAVNYRGSVGFGQDSIDCLLGNVGTQDVGDCHAAVKYVLDNLGIGDKERVCIIGGSHGGFLTAHIIGQFPEFYKAAIVRNPVINIASMLSSTDIPDWCLTESGKSYKQDIRNDPLTTEVLWNCSPIKNADKIQTPTMIMLGEDDRRVPPQQGHELRKLLLARGVPCRTFVYSGVGHPIDKVDSEADAFVNIVKWFNQYVGK